MLNVVEVMNEETGGSNEPKLKVFLPARPGRSDIERGFNVKNQKCEIEVDLLSKKITVSI